MGEAGLWKGCQNQLVNVKNISIPPCNIVLGILTQFPGWVLSICIFNELPR